MGSAEGHGYAAHIACCPEEALDAAVMGEESLLKAKYLGYSFDSLDRFALCHGDFHPGGVMVRGGSVKVIDPEFTAFAPPGLDVGSLLSGFVLAHLFHTQQGPPREGDAGIVVDTHVLRVATRLGWAGRPEQPWPWP